MTIYEIVFQSEGEADGKQRLYCTSKQEMEKTVADLKRSHAAETKAAMESQEKDEYYYRKTFPVYSVADIQTNKLEIIGTPKQMVLWALRYRA